MYVNVGTLPKTNSSPLKIGHPKRKRSYSNHPFSGAMLVSGRVNIPVPWILWDTRPISLLGENPTHFEESKMDQRRDGCQRKHETNGIFPSNPTGSMELWYISLLIYHKIRHSCREILGKYTVSSHGSGKWEFSNLSIKFTVNSEVGAPMKKFYDRWAGPLADRYSNGGSEMGPL